jgi:thiamine-monophosphate kinase
MGGRPLAFTVSATFPPDLPLAWVEELYAGLSEACDLFGCPLVGGDTSSGERVLLSVAMLGAAPSRGALLRSGARPGQAVFVSGSPGESALGLRLLEAGAALGSPDREGLASRHRRPSPRLALGAGLGESGLASAMIDVSDGLLQDLGHVLARSGVGATLISEALPLSDALLDVSAELGLDPRLLVLTGGEDYELLFTGDARRAAEVRELGASLGTEIFPIGVIDQEPGLRLTRGGRPVPLPEARGFDHFR